MAARHLAEYLNAASDYETFCAATLAEFPRDLRVQAQSAMGRPDAAWRKEYSGLKVVEEILVESLDLLSSSQLSTDAMRRFNAFVEREQALHLGLGHADPKFGGVMSTLHDTARAIPGAPTIASVGPGQGGEVVLYLWTLIAGGELARLKRCPQCQRWFVDESKNRAGVRCSTPCTDKWWSRARRRDANHNAAPKRT